MLCADRNLVTHQNARSAARASSSLADCRRRLDRPVVGNAFEGLVAEIDRTIEQYPALLGYYAKSVAREGRRIISALTETGS